MESEIKRLVNELSVMDIWDYPEGFGNKFDELKTLVFAARNISRAVTPLLSIKDRGSDKRLKRACENEKKPQGSTPSDLVLTTAI
jgi:hypothetical protein